MRRNILFRNLVGVLSLVGLLVFSASAQTTMQLSAQRTPDQRIHVYARFVTGGTSTQLLTGSQVTIMSPASSLSVGTSTNVNGTWAAQPKQSDGTNDYSGFVLTAEHPGSVTTYTAGQEIELFNFTTTGSCSGIISINIQPTQFVNSNEVGTAILSSDNNGGSSNAVTGFYDNSVPCQSLTVTPGVSLSTTVNNPITGNLVDDIDPVGGTGTNTYTPVVCTTGPVTPTTPATTSSTQQGGSVVTSGTSYTYTPATNFVGTDQFCIRTCSGTECQITSYTVGVGAPPLNVTPTVSKTATPGTPVTGDVSDEANPTGGTGTYTYASVACNGATPSPTSPPIATTSQNGYPITVDPTTGEYTYTPAANFTGNDQFCIRVCSGNDCKVVTYIMTANSNCPPFTLPTLSK